MLDPVCKDLRNWCGGLLSHQGVNVRFLAHHAELVEQMQMRIIRWGDAQDQRLVPAVHEITGVVLPGGGALKGERIWRSLELRTDDLGKGIIVK